MTISFRAEQSDGVLVITATGRDDNLQQVIDYGSSVIELAVKNGARYILCDERGLEYTLDTYDTFRSAQEIAARAPKVLRIAIVCGERFFEDGKFWETVAVNRALHVRFDTDIGRARVWLLKDRDPGDRNSEEPGCFS